MTFNDLEDEDYRAYVLQVRAMICGGRDWHARRGAGEPRCGPRQWRCKDRHRVLEMAALDDDHLGHAIRFAETRPQHAGKLAALLEERAQRERICP